jgi:hypothetical protein
MPASRRRRKTSPALRRNSRQPVVKRYSARRSPARPPTGHSFKKLMAALGHGDIVIIPAVDRLSRDTTDLLVIAREMQRAGAGIRSLAEPFLDTTSDLPRSFLRSSVSPRSWNTAASRSARHEAAPMRRRRE